MCSYGAAFRASPAKRRPIARGGENTALAMLLEQVQDSRMQSKRLAGVNGFHCVFNLLNYGALQVSALCGLGY
jgi:hypothetical protein